MKHFGIAFMGLLAIAMTTPAAHAAGNAVKGKAAFARCAICHGVKPGEKRMGPTLAGVFGRKAGLVPGFVYSPAMKKAPVKWDAKALDAYITRPMAFIPGNRMAFAGVADATMRADIIAYLATLK